MHSDGIFSAYIDDIKTQTTSAQLIADIIVMQLSEDLAYSVILRRNPQDGETQDPPREVSER